jgi:hypothetical protein
VKSPAAVLVAAALSALSCACAQASPTPVQPAAFDGFGFAWTATPGVLPANTGPGVIVILPTPSATSPAGGDIPAVYLRAFSAASPTDPAQFAAADYTLTLILTDVASGRTGRPLTFTGHLDGTLAASTTDILNPFTGPQVRSERIGDNLYTVTIGNYGPPPPPDSGRSGSIGATVLVQPVSPEPPACLLAALGAAGLATGAWGARRWRRGPPGLSGAGR